MAAAWVAAALVLVLVAASLLSRRIPEADPAPQPPQDADLVAALEARVAAANPSDVAVLQQLGVAYTQRAISTSDPAYYELASRTFDRADATSPAEIGTLTGRGTLELSKHNFAVALELGTAAAGREPADTDALGILVDANVELGDYTTAAAHLQRMLDIGPDLAALARVSYLRELHGDLQGASAAMTQALGAGSGTGPAAARVAVLAGDLALRRGSLDSARSAYSSAARMGPDNLGAQVGMARVAVADGEIDTALEMLERATDRVPDPAALALLAGLQASTGREADAAATATRVRAVTKLAQAAGAVVDIEVALFEADLGDPTEAVRAARAAHPQRSANVYAADALAWALVRSGDGASAVPLVEAALRLGSDDPLLHVHAAFAYTAVGGDNAARAHLETAFAGTPWMSPSLRGPATDLAARLGVPVPDRWKQP